ncbi:MAG: hypothetical protein CBC48_05955 [bacterium TMED88]|nr:hypothetical protein [Deltaproteobacteria bacterium]OUV34415.1 MAG: hypothetical protein CBC48_05955 [bacterium TMED88]
MSRNITMSRSKSQTGYSIAEVVVVAAIVGALMALAVPSTRRYLDDQTATDVARSLAHALQLARTEALRTGRNHVVFFSVGGAGDAAGNPLLDSNGQAAALVILDDGVTGSAGQNCQIDAGETTRSMTAQTNTQWGQSFAGSLKAPGDLSPMPLATGSSFARPNGTAATWVLFRPDGIPVATDAACNPGVVGTGNGAVYFTNGDRDYAITLSALGAAHVHTWNRATGEWKS